jgi:CHAT domain-containing protein/Tfp pilus assembly protein PilF
MLDDNQQALDYYQRALPLRRALGDRRGEATTLNNIAAIYDSLGQPQRAVEYHNESLAIRRAVGDTRGEGLALNNLGEAYSTLGDTSKALDFYNRALSIHQATGNRSGEASTLGNIGHLYRAAGEYDRAMAAFTRSLDLARAVADPENEARMLVAMSRVERARGSFNPAYAHAESARRIVESLRARISDPDLRASYLAAKHAPYELGVDVLMAMSRDTPSGRFAASALELSERARARSLVDLLVEANADIRQGIDPALLERERTLQRRISAKRQEQIALLNTKHTDEQAEVAKRALETLLTAHQEAQADIRRSSPRYAALTEPRPFSLDEIQRQVLDDDTLLLEYWLGDTKSYVWAITRTSLAAYDLPARAEIEQAARRAYQLLRVSQRRINRKQTELALEALSRIVLGPVAAHLGRMRLLVVADGALRYVPFGALYLPSTRRSASGESPTPLIVDHEVVSLPSASVLAVQRHDLNRRSPASKLVAVLADPVLQGGDPRVNRAASGRTGSRDAETTANDTAVRFERLPFTREEAETVAALAGPGDSLKALDFDASRATLTGGALEHYRIIHLATHGIFDTQHPELSGLVLSLIDRQGQPQDGFIRALEIYNLKLPSELVVLSACETALGKEVKGEGLIGLVRGFMYAGAARVVASMWDVRDQATAVLMKRFYEGMLKNGLTPAAALRSAQISLWKDKRWEAPYYWAGFVMQGEYR